MNNQVKKMVKNFLNEVEEKLPGWLKENKVELDDVLTQLEEHVYEKAEALAKSEDIDASSMRQAIFDMGKPEDIAKEYKRRSTPKVFISEELWPTYLNVLKYVAVIIVSICVLVATTGGIISFLIGEDWVSALWNPLTAIFPAVMVIGVIATVAFTYLSMEGWTLHDIKEMFRDEDEKKAHAEMIKRHEMGLPEAPKKMPEFIKSPAELTAGGIFAIIFGLLFIIQPIGGLVALIPSLFLFLMRILGIFMLVQGVLDLINGMFAIWTYQAHKGFIIVGAIVSLCTIPVWTILFLNPQIMPLVFWTVETGIYVHGINPDYYWIFGLVLIIIIIGTIAGAIDETYKASQFNVEDFYQK